MELHEYEYVVSWHCGLCCRFGEDEDCEPRRRKRLLVCRRLLLFLAPSLQKPTVAAAVSFTNTYSPGQRNVTKLPSTGYQEIAILVSV